MAASDLLLGFDLREPAGGGWDERRRRAYLFRLDVGQPTSIDRRVWRSVFDRHPDLAPRYTGVYAGLWADLDRLRQRLRAAALDLDGFSLAAFALSRHAGTAAERTQLEDFLTGVGADGSSPGSGPLAALARPSRVQRGWRFLGWDVADLGATSGLTNMGFVPGFDDAAALRDRWAPHLNARHLFEDRSRAEEFKIFSNRRVPEHAPFYVVGIWRVGQA